MPFKEKEAILKKAGYNDYRQLLEFTVCNDKMKEDLFIKLEEN